LLVTGWREEAAIAQFTRGIIETTSKGEAANSVDLLARLDAASADPS
jgi:hypothetical protein